MTQTQRPQEFSEAREDKIVVALDEAFKLSGTALLRLPVNLMDLNSSDVLEHVLGRAPKAEDFEKVQEILGGVSVESKVKEAGDESVSETIDSTRNKKRKEVKAVVNDVVGESEEKA